MATLLAQMASGEPVRAAHFARRHGYARSTVFDLARRMQAMGLVVRDDGGFLLPGPAAYDLAWSRHGLQGLRGPAEAVLLWLRDNADVGAAVVAGDEELLSVPAPAAKGGRHATVRSLAVRDGDGKERLRLVVDAGQHADPARVASALGRAAATLAHHLEASA